MRGRVRVGDGRAQHSAAARVALVGDAQRPAVGRVAGQLDAGAVRIAQTQERGQRHTLPGFQVQDELGREGAAKMLVVAITARATRKRGVVLNILSSLALAEIESSNLLPANTAPQATKCRGCR